MKSDLYNILNIPQSEIIENENNINYYLKLIEYAENQEALKYFHNVINILNRFHSYFHFEQSYVYLISAYLYSLQNNLTLKDKYLEKSIFQDHINIEALNFENSLGKIFSYEKSIKTENEFLNFAINVNSKSENINLLDSAINHVLNLNMKAASLIIKKIGYYNSHRFFIAKAIIAHENDLDLAIHEINKAIDILENSHKAYHQYASNIYKQRANIYYALDQVDLAKNDLIKAKDLLL